MKKDEGALRNQFIILPSSFCLSFYRAGVIPFLVSPVFVESRYHREVKGRLAMERLEFRIYAVQSA